MELLSAINLALQAKILLIKDIDYIVKNNEIKLVDEFTGRIVDDRKWRNGLQTAVEAKEKVKINSEGMILNSITLQHLLQKYPKISGMSATVKQSSEEFKFFYNLNIVVIPANKTCNRIDHPDLIFDSIDEKNAAIVEEVKKKHKTGQPILIGTLSVKESEVLEKCFRDNNIFCEVLNAKNDEIEAEIIGKAGMKGAVTISTNMAGRGTDIILGGKEKKDREDLIKLGGLYVIGTNRHESSRIDKQLRGRAARQGDIGESKFFVSFEDNLMVKYKLNEALFKEYKNVNKRKLNYKTKLKYISHIQKVIEGESFDMRRTLFDYSAFIEKQRTIIQNERTKIVLSTDIQLIESITSIKNSLQFVNDCKLRKLKEIILFQYDKFWAEHLDYLSEIKEGIHLLRIGGKNPLIEFQKKADISFKRLSKSIDTEIENKVNIIIKNLDVDLLEIGIKKPSSTWTYVINDYPFGNQLSNFLLDNSNMVQADILSVTILFFYRMFKKKFVKPDDFN